MTINELSSAIYLDVMSGLRGMGSTTSLSLEQLEDEIITERLVIMKEWYLKNMLSYADLYTPINCVEVNCDSINKCCKSNALNKMPHFEIPPLYMELGLNAIDFIGSLDKTLQLLVYTDTSFLYHKYKKRGSIKPYVYINCTLNTNGNYDGYIFNLPYIKMISLIGIFKDPRKLSEYNCCNDESFLDITYLSNEIQKRLTEKKLRYYRQFIMPITPNNQEPK